MSLTDEKYMSCLTILPITVALGCWSGWTFSPPFSSFIFDLTLLLLPATYISVLSVEKFNLIGGKSLKRIKIKKGNPKLINGFFTSFKTK